MRLRLAMIALAAAPAVAGGLAEDPHLPVVPRTAAEAARVAAVTAPPADFSTPQPFEENAGGAGTTRRSLDANAFSWPAENLSFAQELTFKLGNGLFRRLWVTAPSSTIASDGLGPLYNARGCQSCHLKDGRGHAPDGPDDGADTMLVRISTPVRAPGEDPLAAEIEGWLATAPHPAYGGQIQDHAVAGHAAEARVVVEWTERPVPLAGGETVSRRAPAWRLENLAYGPLGPDAMLSPRVAPPMIGLGLLEAIPAADILALADPDDADGDGISGRASVVWSAQFDRPMLGRFGWKAGEPTLREQAAGAFSGDMGLSTPLDPAVWGDCTAAQAACRAAPHGGQAEQGGFEVDDAALDLVAFYSANLAVPARRDVGDPQTLRGKALFHEAGCAACHRPSFATHRLAGRDEQSFQLVWPYTDLLLHDMGEGLADGRPDGVATGREWRTPPLWGVGLAQTVSPEAGFLHDGRARTLMEAVLWHGGEAQPARDAVAAMAKPDRDALIRFLESL